MDAKELAIDTVSLDRDAAALGDCLGRARVELNGLMEALFTLNRMWEGPANESFAEQFRIDAEMMEELQDTVKRFSEDMRSASSEYRRCGERVEDVLAALKI
ncbi:MAG: WXG100 family type VII secretion target [Oscillospiraceae bacterium]|nr:WXG100 family type VII secretion target [Oscillospiraceae bacterium]